MSSNSQEKILICKGTSGMGNRILAACTALLYGEITGRKVFIDWQEGNYSEIGKNAFPLFFDCANPILIDAVSNSYLTSQSIVPKLWESKLDTSFGKMRADLSDSKDKEVSIDVSLGNYEEEVVVFGAYTHQTDRLRSLFKGKFQYLSEMDDSEVLKMMLNRDFKLVPELGQSIEQFKRDKFGNSTLGVHVRYTDMKIPVEPIISKVKQALGKERDRTIFLATDAEEIIGKFRSIFPNVVTTEKWFPEAGGRLHLLNVPDKFENGVEAIRDLFLLKECDGLVFSSQSSFGRVASLLSSAPKKHIYDIEKRSVAQRLKSKVKSVLGR
ncbi:MAG: nodulation protein NodZ [Cyanobacteria bacterium P01_F01_bin.153]